MFVNTDKKVQESSVNYYCEKCNFSTSRKSQYNRHLLTNKHKILINTDEKGSEKLFYCDCGKKYKHSQSLYNHKKKCNFIDKEKHDSSKEKIINNDFDNIFLVNKDDNDLDYKSMFLQVINENKEMRGLLMKQQDQISELIPKVGMNNNNIKQKFNINVFLNEKCKDAISMDEFINKIEVSMKNLLTTKEKGQVNGITNIIMENMNKLSLYERPLHCTDKKRETLYVKNNEWEKDENKECINKALKSIESKQLKNLNVWLDEHPNYMNNPSQQEEFAKLMSECGKSVEEGREKIIKNICDNVYIEKQNKIE